MLCEGVKIRRDIWRDLTTQLVKLREKDYHPLTWKTLGAQNQRLHPKSLKDTIEVRIQKK